MNKFLDKFQIHKRNIQKISEKNEILKLIKSIFKKLRELLKIIQQENLKKWNQILELITIESNLKGEFLAKNPKN